MPKRHSAIDEASRYILVFGAILLLVANLIPRGGGKDAVLILGGILTFAGIIGMGIAVIVGNNKRQPSRQSSRRR